MYEYYCSKHTPKSCTPWFVARLSSGIFSPRVSNNAQPLPTAREVSIFINEQAYIADFDEDENSPINSLHMMQIGQFVDHDLTHTPAQGGKSRDCTSKHSK